VDLLAYYQIAHDARNPARYGLLQPMRLDDEITIRLLERKKLTVRPSGSGRRHHGITPQAAKWARAKMIREGQDPKAVEFFLNRAVAERARVGHD